MQRWSHFFYFYLTHLTECSLTEGRFAIFHTIREECRRWRAQTVGSGRTSREGSGMQRNFQSSSQRSRPSQQLLTVSYSTIYLLKCTTVYTRNSSILLYFTMTIWLVSILDVKFSASFEIFRVKYMLTAINWPIRLKVLLAFLRRTLQERLIRRVPSRTFFSG